MNPYAVRQVNGRCAIVRGDDEVVYRTANEDADAHTCAGNIAALMNSVASTERQRAAAMVTKAGQLTMDGVRALAREIQEGR